MFLAAIQYFFIDLIARYSLLYCPMCGSTEAFSSVILFTYLKSATSACIFFLSIVSNVDHLNSFPWECFGYRRKMGITDEILQSNGRGKGKGSEGEKTGCARGV